MSEEKKFGPWIDWAGGGCPVGGGVMVRVKLRDGAEGESRADDYRWPHFDSAGDIVAYRVEQPAVDPAFPAAHYGHDLKVGDGHEAITFHALPVKDQGTPENRGQKQLVATTDGGIVGIGDINSSAKGSGARYNTGKTPFELIPLRMIAQSILSAETFGHRELTAEQHCAARALQRIGDYQARSFGLEALYEAMYQLAPNDLEQAWRECAQVFDYGAKKYAPLNWCKGMKWSVAIACAARHCLAIINGEQIDIDKPGAPGSGLPHRGHIFCNLVMLITFAQTYTEGDDRPPAGMFAANDDAMQAVQSAA